MIRCNKSKKNRVGFTLLEMVLVLAIMVMISAYLMSTFKIVNISHLRVATVNDMHDYASLNLRAIENSLCNATVIKAADSDHIIKCKANDPYIKKDSGNLLGTFQQYGSGTDSGKWLITLTFKTHPASKTVDVTISFKDNNSPSSGVVYSDTKTIYCPACVDMADLGTAGSNQISYSLEPQE